MKRLKHFCIGCTALLGLAFLFGNELQAQVVEDFEIRFQTQQNGGIQFLANTSLYCGTGSQCVQAQNAMPITGFPQDNNNDHNMVYFNSDDDASTWSSSSDSLSLGICAEISFAGLYWAGRLGNGFVANEALKDQVKIKAADGDAYIDVFAEESIDFDASNTDNYCCFADITEWASNNPVNARYTVANVVADQDDSSWGGWVLILVYADAAEPMRNLTVFDGLAMITAGWNGGADNSTVDVPISGFLTPPFGPVDLNLGVVAYDGDRGSSGDQLGFDGTGSFNYIEDATHDVNNVFNSTHSTGGIMNPWRVPAFNNTLGHDANIFIPDNSGYDFLPNNATDAEIRVTTGGESITVHAITSSIDVYEPDLRATVYIEDLNGGVAEPGDILEYTVVAKNLGSDAATEVYMTNTLDIRTNFVEGSLVWDSAPLTGWMTDAAGDDPGEFLVDDQMVQVRIGATADGTTGGTLNNDPTGQDSISYRFQVQLTDDCLLLQCDGTLTGAANIYGFGDISGNTQTNDGASALLDANGCPVEEVTTLEVQTGICPPVAIEPVGTTCLGDDVALEVPAFMDNPLAESLANYSWSGPNGFTSSDATAYLPSAELTDAGSYFLEVTFTGLECLLSSANYEMLVHVPTPLFDAPESQCIDGNAFDFAAQGDQFPGATFQWSFENSDPGTVAGAYLNDIAFNQPGWNEVVLTLNEIGCTAEVLDSIFVESPPDLASFDVDILPSDGCVPLSVTFMDAAPTEPMDYSWEFGDGYESLNDIAAHVYDLVGTFDIEVTATSLGNCPATITFPIENAVTVFPAPQAGFEVDPNIVELLTPFVTITSTADANAFVNYYFSDGGSLSGAHGEYSFSDGGSFDIIQTVISPEGCIATAEGAVVVNGTIFYAPSGFTPDGDFLNDVWKPVALGVTSYQMEVRNRWGDLFWSTDDPETPWLGQSTSGSHFAPNGMYVWQVTYRDQLGFPVMKQGTVSLMR
ncbi:PKD domain-containing protein [Flavobacteriales bacterium]|nr:PKD domain-containing protein [Flavobacteriales bacterium]